MSKTSTLKASASHRGTDGASAAAAFLGGPAKWLIVPAAVVVAVGTLVVVARPDANAGPSAAPAPAQAAPVAGVGRLTAMRARYNFGTVSMKAGKVTHRYAISNAGDAPLTIRKIYTSCMCTTARIVKNGRASDAFGMPGHTPIPDIDLPLAPTDGAYVEVVFDPAAHGPAGVGPIERAIVLETSAGRPLELQFAALVTP